MAQSTPTTTLTDSLVVSLSQNDLNNAKLRRRRDLLTRKLRTHNLGRTNQFDVWSRLDGLQEKFTILSNDELSDALRSRLVELQSKDYKWTPEILDLLLHLSNDPLAKSKVEDLQKLLQPDEPPPLTWADIEGEDPIDRRDDIWKTIRFTDYSSDEEETVSSNVTAPTSDVGGEEALSSITERLVRPASVDDELEKSLRKGQFWRRMEASFIEVSELQAIREAIFMLRGLPSSIFWRVGEAIEIDERYGLNTLDKSTFHAILLSCAAIGCQIDRVRQFVSRAQNDNVLQTFQEEVEFALSQFDVFLSDQETYFLSDTSGHIVSLIALLDLVQESSDALLAILRVLKYSEKDNQRDGVNCMEALFNSINHLEATGQTNSLRSLEEIFSKTFRTYLQSIGKWVKSGQLDNKPDFFIKRTDSQDKARLWSEWFILQPDANTRMPSFLVPHATSILIAGKSAAMLRSLEGPDQDSASFDMDIVDTLRQSHKSLLIRFEHRINEMLQRLIEPHYNIATRSLHRALDETCGLRKTLSALQKIYFGDSGSAMDLIASKTFERIDKCRTDWNDPFLLGQLFKSNMRSVEDIDVEAVRLKAVTGYSRDMIRRRRSVNILKGFALEYKLSWSLSNIISPLSLVGYQRVSTLLFQIRRAIYALERQSLQHIPLTDKRSYRQIYTTRQRLLTFTKTLFNHLTNLIVEVATQEVLNMLDQAADIDGMIKAHNAFVMSLQHRYLLTKALKPLREAVLAILDLCIQFADTTNSPSKPSHADKEPNADAMSFVSARSRGRHKGKLLNTESSDEEEKESDQEPYSILLADDDQRSQNDHVVDIDKKFNQHVSFIVAGLRGLARADQDSSVFWDILAERLDGCYK